MPWWLIYLLVMSASFGVWFFYRVAPRSFAIYAFIMLNATWLLFGEGIETTAKFAAERAAKVRTSLGIKDTALPEPREMAPEPMNPFTPLWVKVGDDFMAFRLPLDGQWKYIGNLIAGKCWNTFFTRPETIYWKMTDGTIERMEVGKSFTNDYRPTNVMGEGRMLLVVRDPRYCQWGRR